MYVLYLLLLKLVSINCVYIRYNEVYVNRHHYKNISATEINNKVLSGLVHNIKILQYYNNEIITSIKDLPELIDVDMSGLYQFQIPKLENLNKLYTFNMSNNNLNEVPAHVFNTVKYIDLSINDISVISKGAFPEPTLVDLSCNSLKNFNRNWFKDPRRLITLRLRGNQITKIPPLGFSEFLNLDMLDLSFNKIHTIGSGALSFSDYFGYLDLSYNKLTDLKPDIFSDEELNINFWNIEYNDLGFLRDDLLKRLSTVTTPGIDGNPWKCACYLQSIIQWVNWNTYGEDVRDRRGAPRCVVANTFYICTENVNQTLIDFFRENRPVDKTREDICP